MLKQKNKNEILRAKFPQAVEGNIVKADYFFFDTQPNYPRGLSIVFGGFEKCAADFEIKRNSYPYFVLEYITQGRCTLQIADREYQLKKGDLAGFSPKTFHHYKCCPKEPMQHYFIAFTGTEADKLLQISGIKQKGVLNADKYSQTGYLIEKIFSIAKQSRAYSRQLSTCYLRALLLEQSFNSSFEDTNSSVSMATYNQCKKYIDEHFSIPQISPSFVARKCGINVRYMSRLFKGIADIQPRQYIDRLKLNKAVSMLLTTNLSISRIAYSIGYLDQYHFSRNFKKAYGLSPNNFRKSHI